MQNGSGSMSATGWASSRSTSRRTVPVETSPPSIQPFSARTRVARSSAGRRRMLRGSLGVSLMPPLYGGLGGEGLYRFCPEAGVTIRQGKPFPGVPAMTAVPLEEAGARLAEIVDQLRPGEEVVLVRAGRPV